MVGYGNINFLLVLNSTFTFCLYLLYLTQDIMKRFCLFPYYVLMSIIHLRCCTFAADCISWKVWITFLIASRGRKHWAVPGVVFKLVFGRFCFAF